MANHGTEDWKLCRDWIVMHRILSDDHSANSPSASLFDFANVLRDGVLLCHLLNKLSPGVIDIKEFSQRPQMSQFLCRKNIRTFLTKCVQNFRMKQQDLFDPDDLFELSGFENVINVLSKLSKTPESSRLVPPFSSSSSKKDYTNLNDFTGEEEPSDDIYDSVRTAYERDDEIYDDIMRIRRESQQITATKSPTRRDHCISELVETERNYVDVLNMLLQHFVRPLENVLTPNDHEKIFACIEKLHRIHTGFHSELSKACKGAERQAEIPDCFIKWKESFIIYGEYCSNLPAAQERVDEVSKKSVDIQQQIRDCQMNANEGRFQLRDLLSVPMQRVLKYHLLLKELIKNTDKQARDRAALHKALEEMQDLSLYINEVKRDNEALQIIHDIQNSITDLQMPENTSLRDYGRLLKDGELKIKKHPETKTKNRHIFLFDKVMLMCRSRGETYNYKHALVLSQYRIEINAKDKTFPFMLVEKSGNQVYTFQTKNEEMRTKWTEAIRMAHENTSPCMAHTREHDFIMHCFDVPTICDVCRKLLRGVFYQGYKCSMTGMAVHKECITKAGGIAGPPQPPPRPMPQNSSSSNVRQSLRPAMARGTAKYTHQGNMAPAGESRPLLLFNYGDIIEILDMSNQNWWEGRLQGREGIFPPNYVELKQASGPRYKYEEQQNPRRSNLSLDGGDGPPPFPNGHAAGRGDQGYSNLHGLTDEPWYAAELERDRASQLLAVYRDGTYLVRKSTNPRRMGEHALSIKFGSGLNAVKHIKIEQNRENMYYIADCKLFRRIEDLVRYYSDNSLEPSFPDLQTTLLFPYKESTSDTTAASERLSQENGSHSAPFMGSCVANFDYAANQPNQLSLNKGDRVAIINKAGDARGWWKGQLDGRTGYFPSAYVEEEE